MRESFVRGEADASPLMRLRLGDDAVKRSLLSICLPVVIAVGSITCGGNLSASNQPLQDNSYGGAATDYADLVDSVRAAGARVETAGEVDQPFFSVKGRMITVHGEDVQVFQYPDATGADAEAALVSPDGSAVGTTTLHWIGSPHFYKKGRLLVLYVGDTARVLKALEAALGRQFAGK
jgi:hypothetical protein